MSNLSDWLIQNEPSFGGTRPQSLYSDLTQLKASRPDSYPANVTAWLAAITRAALAGRLPNDNGQKFVLQISDDLLSSLASQRYGAPTGLGTVLDDCINQGKMMELNDFATQPNSIYTRSWIPSPWDVLRWGFKQVGVGGIKSYNVNGRLRNGQLVVVPALEEASRQILRAQQKRGQTLTDRIMSKDDFARDLATMDNATLSSQDIDLLLKFLARDKQVLSYDDKTIKFKTPNTASPDPITAEDGTIASLKFLISNLTVQVTALEKRIASLQSTAQTCVKAGNKTSALSALRSKKLAENALQQRTNTLNQLEEVYTRIEQAVDQIDIVEAMESSATVLKSLNHRIGGVERVDQVVDDLREEMSQVDEVGQILRDPSLLQDPTTAAVDEVEVDEELEQMEREEKTRKQEAEAAATRQRLMELDANNAQRKQTETTTISVPQTINNDSLDAELARSVERISQLNLDPNETSASRSAPAKANPSGGEKHTQIDARVKVAEPAM